MALFGYGSVNTRGQTTEDQRLEIERAGYAVDYWFSDIVKGTAHSSQRARLGRLLSTIRQNDTLVVSNLDRLGRDAQNVLSTIKTLDSLGAKTIVLRLGLLDSRSYAGKLMLSMLTAVAEMERSLFVQRTQAGLKRARAEGKPVGRPPKTNQKQREAMVEAYGRGISITTLAQLYALSRSTVRMAVKQTHHQ